MRHLERAVGAAENLRQRVRGVAREIDGRVDVLHALFQRLDGLPRDRLHAQSTATLSDQVRENAAAGRTAVEVTVSGIRTAQESTRRTAGAFDELQRSLGKIDQILLFIDEVTNRTNLLALNAAIIAAHARRGVAYAAPHTPL